jgi:predicted XRE-type DNA-binding protein
VKTELAKVLASLTRNMLESLLAFRLGIHQTEASTLRQGHLKRYSIERLIVFATRLGCDVEIRVGPPQYTLHAGPRTGRLAPGHQGAIHVVDDTQGRAAGLFR